MEILDSELYNDNLKYHDYDSSIDKLVKKRNFN